MVKHSQATALQAAATALYPKDTEGAKHATSVVEATQRRSLHDEHNEQEDTAIRNHQAQIDVENWVTADGESKFSNQNLGSNQRQASHLARQPSPNNQGPRNAAAPA
ncbi:MAG: hypothetical protein Q9223_006751 [Gallowayella weberi]